MYSWICFHLIIPAAEPLTTVALQINVVKAEATVHIYASNTAIVHFLLKCLKLMDLFLESGHLLTYYMKTFA